MLSWEKHAKVLRRTKSGQELRAALPQGLPPADSVVATGGDGDADVASVEISLMADDTKVELHGM